jgi:glycosyltransferase involved in cell wall biosynthesis
MARVIRAKLPPRLYDRVHVIPIGADPECIRPLAASNNGFRRTWQADGEFVALYAGNMGACHDVETILDAAALIRDEPIRIVFSGDGVKRSGLEARVRARGLTQVSFGDYVPAARLNDLLAACDAGLLAVEPSADGLLVSCKVYNLMAAAKPVVALASAKGEVGMTIAEAKCGVLIEPGRATKLAECLKALARDHKSCTTMGAAGRRYLAQHLTRQRRAQRFAEVFRSVGAGTQRPVDEVCQSAHCG